MARGMSFQRNVSRREWLYVGVFPAFRVDARDVSFVQTLSNGAGSTCSNRSKAGVGAAKIWKRRTEGKTMLAYAGFGRSGSVRETPVGSRSYMW